MKGMSLSALKSISRIHNNRNCITLSQSRDALICDMKAKRVRLNASPCESRKKRKKDCGCKQCKGKKKQSSAGSGSGLAKKTKRRIQPTLINALPQTPPRPRMQNSTGTKGQRRTAQLLREMEGRYGNLTEDQDKSLAF